jgi:predicted dehydrogenase
MSDNTFNICLVGCGGIAKRFHGPSYERYAALHEGIELAACCDTHAQAAKEFADRFGFARHYTDIDEMLDSERPSAVCLAVPYTITAELAIRVLERGYPLLTEKPPGMNRAEIDAMIDAADRSGMPNQAAFNRRYMPLVQELKRLMDPGDIYTLRYEMSRVNRRDSDFSTTAIHGIDTARYIAGSDYRRADLYYQEMPELGPGVCNMHLYAEFESGATAQLAFTPVAGALFERAEIVGLDQTITLYLPVPDSIDGAGGLVSRQGGKVSYSLDGGDIPDGLEPSVANGFYRENESFFDDVIAGRKPEGDLRSGIQAVEISACMRERRPEYKR